MSQVTLKPPVDPRERIQDSRSTGMAPLKPAISVQESDKKAPVETVAPKSEPDKKEEKPSPELEARYEDLAKRERAIRAQARETQTLKKEIEDLKALIKAPQQSFTKDDFRKQFLQDPTSVGLSYDDIANLAMNAPTPENQLILAMRKEIDELKAGQNKVVDGVEQQKKQAYDQALKQISREVESLVNDDTDGAFETIKSLGRQDAVTALIEETYKEEGYVLSVEEAAKQVEDHLVEQALSMAKIKKISSKLNPQEQQQSQQQQSPKQSSTTLTHAGTQQSTQSLSPKDRRARAIAAFTGSLK